MWMPVYRGLSILAGPLIKAILERRVAAGKEDPHRLGERRGLATQQRPAHKTVVWIHAASVGESVSALPLIDHILINDADAFVVLTSGTLSSARLMANRLPERAVHQFAPLDRPRWVRRFLSHWQPTAVIFIESEIWPNMIVEAKAAGLPVILVNGRMSVKSFKQWHRWRRLSQALFPKVDLVLAVDDSAATHFSALGARQVAVSGNLKLASPPLPLISADHHAFIAALGDRPIWLAASTHPGEDDIVLAAHAHLVQAHPDLLTVIVPRHPNRGGEIRDMATASGFSAVQRSEGRLPTPQTAIYVADTLGEIAVFFAAAPIVFVAGSLVPVGGHNPLEPCHFDCAVLFGPLMHKNAAIARRLLACGGAIEVSDAADLARQVGRLLTDPELGHIQAAAAATEARRNIDLIGTIYNQVAAFLKPSGQHHEGP